MKTITYLLLVFLFFLYSNSITSQTKPLHIYGGENNDVYLGCINCSNYDSNSIWNNYGKYGNNYNSTSIWNSYGSYGSDYGAYSPFNSYASTPPVIVDSQGNFYGYFTTNAYKSKRADFDLAMTIYKNYKQIREDVSGWYDKIFD